MAPFVAHVAALCLGVAGPLVVGAWVYSRGRGRDAVWFAALMFVVAVSTFGYVVQLIAPGPAATRAVFYARAPLAVAIGPMWLVFALWYSGREDRLTRRLRALLGAGYLALTLTILTNEWHGLTYPLIEYVQAPFPHLVATHGPAYWVGFAAVYVVVGVALWLIARLVVRSRHVSRRQAALVLVSGVVAVGINLAENLELFPIEGFEYTMVGAALFSAIIGIAIFSHRLFDVQPVARDRVVETIDDPVVVVDADRRLVDYNPAAAAAFPGIELGVGEPLSAVAPTLCAGEGSDQPFTEAVERFREGKRHTYSVSVTPLATERDSGGHALVLKDVTELQSYARQLERQAEQFEQVASVISHDLRGPLTVLAGAIELAREDGEEHLDRAEDAVDRMEDIVEGTLALAREGQEIGDRTVVDLADVARAAWETTGTDGASLAVDLPDDLSIYADETRLQSCFENLFRNAVEHGSTSPRSSPSHEDAVEHGSSGPDGASPGENSVTVLVGCREEADGASDGANGPTLGAFYVEDDGPGIPPEDRASVTDAGYSTSPDGTGLGLAIVSTIAQGHDWETTVEDGDLGGARVVLSNVQFLDADEGDRDGEGDGARDGAGTDADAGRERAIESDPVADADATD